MTLQFNYGRGRGVENGNRNMTATISVRVGRGVERKCRLFSFDPKKYCRGKSIEESNFQVKRKCGQNPAFRNLVASAFALMVVLAIIPMKLYVGRSFGCPSPESQRLSAFFFFGVKRKTSGLIPNFLEVASSLTFFN